MYLCITSYVEPVSSSKDYVRSGVKFGSVLCLYTPVSRSVPEMEGMIIVCHGRASSFMKLYLWRSLCALHLLACQVRLTVDDSGLSCCGCVMSFKR